MKDEHLKEALRRTQNFLLSSQQPDGTWKGLVESDPRPTAFYLITVRLLERGPDERTRQMELYLSSKQLSSGAWQAWPEGPPDRDVTATCEIALQIADTECGRKARIRAQKWLSSQPLPGRDSFWQGLLALNGDLSWGDLPYLSPRLISNPSWLHPNIYDFSFLRIAIVSASLMQAHPLGSREPIASCEQSRMSDEIPEFADWKRRWIATCRLPVGGSASFACRVMRIVDSVLPTARHSRAALEWLLAHQESDGSFFSSVHMTSIAILALHKVDARQFRARIEAGLEAMHNWQVMDGHRRKQQFTDSTNWDTFLSLDLLSYLGVSKNVPQIQKALSYATANQLEHLGDWSHRVSNPSPGGWAFQRVGKWYPDNDDTVMAITALLNFEDAKQLNTVRRGIQWLLAMQSKSGGWASWDRDDRSWIQIPHGGPWFARDLDSSEITARIVVLLSRLVRGAYKGLEDLTPSAREALSRGERWLKRNRTSGIWYGRWFTHYLYGTSHALEAYRELGLIGKDPEIHSTLDWLNSVANADGGFGEALDSGKEGKFVAAASTPFHTACALMAYVHADAADHEGSERAANWLAHHQNEEGTWTNEDFFAAGVPGLWYANFTLTPTYFAAKSLLLFIQSRSR